MKLRQRQASSSSGSGAAFRAGTFGQDAPDGAAAHRPHGRHAGLTAAAALDQALHRFQAVEIVAVDVAVADTDGFLDGAPQGRSIEGIRQVTGSDEPAIKGKPIWRAVSTISLAQSQRHDRCLSLNTGAHRPERRKTSTICWKNSKSRIQGLALGVAGIITVLADEQDAIDGQLSGSPGQRPRRSWDRSSSPDAARPAPGSGSPEGFWST